MKILEVQDWTIIHVTDYIKYEELSKLPDELDESHILSHVIISGKMPAWFQAALVAQLVHKHNVKTIAVFRPPANKFLIVWSIDPDYEVLTWFKPTKRMAEIIGITMLDKIKVSLGE